MAATALLAALTWCVFFFFTDPGSLPHWAKCPFHAITGLHCPGCGSTRATHHLLNADPIASLRHNPLLLVLGVPAAIMGVVICVRTLRDDPRPPLRDRPRVAWTLFALVLIFWVLRNIPLETFAILRPPG